MRTKYYSSQKRSYLALIVISILCLIINPIETTSVWITWSKCRNAGGYEIYWYDAAAQSYKLLKTVVNNTDLSFKKYGLKSGQTYSFKIRAYKIIDGVKHYTSFSKTVKISL